MNGLQFLVLIHVLSAVMGVGPTFFGHVMIRRSQTVSEYRGALRLIDLMEYFPKVGGTLAVLTGLALIWIGNYGSFLQLWLVGTLIVYIVLQLIVIMMIMPLSKKLRAWLADSSQQEVNRFPAEQQKIVNLISTRYYIASGLGILIFILMIVKPS